MTKKTRLTTLLAKIEPVSGIDALPTAGLNAIRLYEGTIQPLEGDEVTTQYMQAYFGASESTQVTQYMSMSFKVPFSGVAAAGDEPGVGTLLRMCSVSMTEDAGIKHVFAPVTTDPESGTIYCNIDGILHKSLGVRGNAKVDVAAKGAPSWSFDLMGAFVPLVDAPLPTGLVYTPFLKALPVNKTHTTALLDGITLAAYSFSFDMGNTVTKEDLMNVDSVDITDRVSTGSVTFRTNSIATKNWVAMARDRAKVPLILKHGQAATNTISIQSTLAEIGKPTYGDSNGNHTTTLPLRFIPTDAGNDEWSIEI